MTREKCESVIEIIGLLTPKDINHPIDILNIKLCGIVVLRTYSGILPGKRTYVFYFCCNDVKIRNSGTNSGVVEEILPLSFSVETLVHYFAIDILLMSLWVEIEITTVMTEANIIGINVFPSPILRCQFAIHCILI